MASSVMSPYIGVEITGNDSHPRWVDLVKFRFIAEISEVWNSSGESKGTDVTTPVN